MTEDTFVSESDCVEESYVTSAEVVVENDEVSTEKPPEEENSIEDESCEGTCKGSTICLTPFAPRADVVRDTGAW